MKLYIHQEKMVADTRDALRKNRSVILRSPTGSGKTVCAAHIVSSALAKGSSVIFTVHRRELIKQTMETFDACGIEYGVVAAGYRPDFLQPVQIASIDTLKRRLELVPEPELIIIDEAHHSGSDGWAKVLAFYDKPKIVGLTATPWRLDGRGLGNLFGEIVHGPEVKWLIENKYLSPFRAFCPAIPDLRDVKTRVGDYAVDELEEKMDKATITGDAVSHYKSICPNKRAIAFATTVKHSQHIAETFNAAGISAKHIDGTMSNAERDAAIEDFRQGNIKIISNCNLISEGFDVPAMDAAILLRPTRSLSLYLQQVGRAMRYMPDKVAVILDHAGNILEHGLPTDNFDWSLEGKKKKKKDKSKIPIKICPKCFCAVPSALSGCSECGHVFVGKIREVEHVAGTLNEIDQENWIRTAPYKKVIEAAKTRAELEAIGKARGYKKGFAWAVMQERKERERSGRNAPEATGGIEGGQSFVQEQRGDIG